MKLRAGREKDFETGTRSGGKMAEKQVAEGGRANVFASGRHGSEVTILTAASIRRPSLFTIYPKPSVPVGAPAPRVLITDISSDATEGHDY